MWWPLTCHWTLGNLSEMSDNDARVHGCAQVRLLVLSVLFAPVVLTAYPALQYDICRPLWLRLFRCASLEWPFCVRDRCTGCTVPASAGLCRPSAIDPSDPLRAGTCSRLASGTSLGACPLEVHTQLHAARKQQSQEKVPAMRHHEDLAMQANAGGSGACVHEVGPVGSDPRRHLPA